MTLASGKRRLLLLTYYFPPCAAAATHRALGIVKHLPAFGWDVEVIAPPIMPFEPDDWDLLQSVPQGTRVTRVPFPNSTLWSLLTQRYARYECWLEPASQAMRGVIAARPHDAILTTSPPHCIHRLGLMAKKQFGIPWVACLRDPWATGFPHPRASERRAEEAGIAGADLALGNTPQLTDDLKQAYPAYADRIELLTNGYDPEVFPPRKPVPPGRPDKITLLHCGEIYADRDPTQLFAALQDYNRTAGPDLPRLQLKLVGRLSPDVEATVNRLCKDSDIEVCGHVSYKDAIQQMLAADILVSIQTPSYSHIPSKIYDYIGARKPILSLGVARDIDWVLRMSGLQYQSVPAGDQYGIRVALEQLTRIAIENPIKKPQAQMFTRAHMCEQLSAKLERCWAQRRQRAAGGFGQQHLAHNVALAHD